MPSQWGESTQHAAWLAPLTASITANRCCLSCRWGNTHPCCGAVTGTDLGLGSAGDTWVLSPPSLME